MNMLWLAALGVASGLGAGLLAGLVGIGGGVVVVPVVYYGLVRLGAPADQAAHIAITTSLVSIMPTALVSTFAHWRAGNTDFAFLREWGPAIAVGVVAAQLVAPHLRGSLLTALFAVFCLVSAIRFAVPTWFHPICRRPPDGGFKHIAGVSIGLVSGFAGVGGGIMTNIVMNLCGLPMHKSIGRAAAAGVVVSLPATFVALIAAGPVVGAQLGQINWPILACIAPAQAAAAWFGAQLAQRIEGAGLSRIFSGALAITGIVMLRSSFAV
jgi:uncharacterized protein